MKKWRTKYDPAVKKRYIGGFVEFSKEYIGKPKNEIVEMWFAMSDHERNGYHKKAGKACPKMVDQVHFAFFL